MCKKRTYLVTGAAGFIGSHLSEALIAGGHKVIGIDNFDPYYAPALKRQNLAELTDQAGFVFLEGDIRDQEILDHCFKAHGPEVIVHLAARPGVRGSVAEPLLYTNVNVMGTVNLLSKAAEQGVGRFIFGSSSSVYGADNEVPFSEDQRITMPISPYAASKVAGEAYCHSFHHLYDLPVVCLRFFTVFGPRQRPDLAMNKFARLILAGQPIPVYGDGSASRDFTYVGDIVRGIVAAAEHPDLASPDTFEAINLGSDEPITVLEMVAAIEEAVGHQAQVDWQPLSPGDVPRTWADVRKAKTLLNWQPQVSLEDGLSAFADWYRQRAEVNGVE